MVISELAKLTVKSNQKFTCLKHSAHDYNCSDMMPGLRLFSEENVYNDEQLLLQ